ncbi:hypothetical protein [Thalassolituus oleivorans]|uniref:hypothetical protein n=1 Tax=Thalassolituus oleivorans TaxID=187493 RepID=UPI0023F3736B|nr:hypothetical protein [Thalassolituus oleivorans]
MLEQQRIDYLSAMGITQWMPRAVLPHAATPRWLSDVAQAPEANVGRLQQPSRGANAPVAAADLLSGFAVKAKTSTAEPVRVTSPSAPDSKVITPEVKSSVGAIDDKVRDLSVDNLASSPGIPPRFQLHFLRVSGGGIWICDQSVAPEHLRRFAHRVLKGMQQPMDLLPVPVKFNWPFIESKHDDQSEPVALQALNAQWRFFADQGVSYVLTFGDDSRLWLARIGVQSHYHHPQFIDMLSNASDKRQLWQALRTIPAH